MVVRKAGGGEMSVLKPKKKGFFGRMLSDMAEALDDFMGELDELFTDEVRVSSPGKNAPEAPKESSKAAGKKAVVNVKDVKVVKPKQGAGTSTHDLELSSYAQRV